MKTGLTKKQKTTSVFFDEYHPTVEIMTHNTKLKKKLAAYAQEFLSLCHQTEDDGQGGLTFEIDKSRFSVRLTKPYSDERRQQASERAKENGIHTQPSKEAISKI